MSKWWMRCTQTSKIQTVSARRSLLSIWIQLNEILWKTSVITTEIDALEFVEKQDMISILKI